MSFKQLEYYCERIENLNFSIFSKGWINLPKIRLVDTRTGKVPILATIVEVCWSLKKEMLYFRFSGEDEGIISTMMKHDDPLYNEDVIEVFISETGSLNCYKEFEVNPKNVHFDAIIHNDQKGNIQICKEWHATGWRTKFWMDSNYSRFISIWEIPFSNFSSGCPSVGEVWKMNCYRIDCHAEYGDEYTAWSPTGEIQFHIPEAFGNLRFK